MPLSDLDRAVILAVTNPGPPDEWVTLPWKLSPDRQVTLQLPFSWKEVRDAEPYEASELLRSTFFAVQRAVQERVHELLASGELERPTVLPDLTKLPHNERLAYELAGQEIRRRREATKQRSAAEAGLQAATSWPSLAFAGLGGALGLATGGLGAGLTAAAAPIAAGFVSGAAAEKARQMGAGPVGQELAAIAAPAVALPGVGLVAGAGRAAAAGALRQAAPELLKHFTREAASWTTAGLGGAAGRAVAEKALDTEKHPLATLGLEAAGSVAGALLARGRTSKPAEPQPEVAAPPEPEPEISGPPAPLLKAQPAEGAQTKRFVEYGVALGRLSPKSATVQRILDSAPHDINKIDADEIFQWALKQESWAPILNTGAALEDALARIRKNVVTAEALGFKEDLKRLAGVEDVLGLTGEGRYGVRDLYEAWGALDRSRLTQIMAAAKATDSLVTERLGPKLRPGWEHLGKMSEPEYWIRLREAIDKTPPSTPTKPLEPLPPGLAVPEALEKAGRVVKPAPELSLPEPLAAKVERIGKFTEAVRQSRVPLHIGDPVRRAGKAYLVSDVRGSPDGKIIYYDLKDPETGRRMRNVMAGELEPMFPEDRLAHIDEVADRLLAWAFPERLAAKKARPDEGVVVPSGSPTPPQAATAAQLSGPSAAAPGQPAPAGAATAAGPAAAAPRAVAAAPATAGPQRPGVAPAGAGPGQQAAPPTAATARARPPAGQPATPQAGPAVAPVAGQQAAQPQAGAAPAAQAAAAGGGAQAPPAGPAPATPAGPVPPQQPTVVVKPRKGLIGRARDIWERFILSVYPEGLDQNTKQAMEYYRRRVGLHEGMRQLVAYKIWSTARELGRRPVPEQIEILHRYEQGKPLSPELDPLRNVLQALSTEYFNRLENAISETATHLGVPADRLLRGGYIDNYIMHLFKPEHRGPAAAMLSGPPALLGRRAHLKPRQFPSYYAAMKAGYEPVTTNVFDLKLMELRYQGHFLSLLEWMNDLFRHGWLVKPTMGPKGKLQVPQGYVPIHHDPWLRQYGIYGLPQVVKLIEEKAGVAHIPKSPLEIAHAGFTSAAMRMQMLFNWFHPGLLSAAVIQMEAANAIRELGGAFSAAARGDVARAQQLMKRAIPDFLNAWIAPFTRPKRGIEIIRAGVRDPLSVLADPDYLLASPAAEEHLRRMTRSGLHMGMDLHMGIWNPERKVLVSPTATWRQTLKDAVNHLLRKDPDATWLRRFGDALDVLLRATTIRIMDKWVPAMKVGVTAHLYDVVRELRQPKTPEEAARLYDEVVSHVESVYGQMNLDRLGMSGWIKKGLALLFMYPGWQLGNFLTFLQGTKALAKGAVRPLAEAAGKQIAISEWERLERAFLISQLLVDMGLAISWNYMMTGGKGPETPADLFYFRTGRFNKDGTPEYYVPMIYLRDLVNLGTRPGAAIFNKLHPLPRAALELYSNRDALTGMPIVDPGRGVFSKESLLGGEMAKGLIPHIVEMFQPFSVGAIRSEAGPVTLQDIGRAVAGIHYAPRETAMDRATRMLYRYHMESVKAAPRTKLSLEKGRAERALFEGGVLPDDMQELLGRKDLRELVRKHGVGPFVYYAWPRTPEQLLAVMPYANEDQKRLLAALIIKKINGLRGQPVARLRSLADMISRLPDEDKRLLGIDVVRNAEEGISP